MPVTWIAPPDGRSILEFGWKEGNDPVLAMCVLDLEFDLEACDEAVPCEDGLLLLPVAAGVPLLLI